MPRDSINKTRDVNVIELIAKERERKTYLKEEGFEGHSGTYFWSG